MLFGVASKTLKLRNTRIGKANVFRRGGLGSSWRLGKTKLPGRLKQNLGGDGIAYTLKRSSPKD